MNRLLSILAGIVMLWALPQQVLGQTMCQASFTASPDSINTCTWYFSDQSTGSPIGWFWNFGDNTISTAQNPVKTFTSNGTFNVSLIVATANGCLDTVFQAIIVSGCGVGTSCQAWFTASFDPNNPCIWNFINTSNAATGFTSSWTFSNGSSSSLTNPSTTYVINGNYLVELTITDSTGCTSSFTQFIVVSNCGGQTSNCTANFSAFPDSINACLWYFNDQSLGTPVTWSWDFDDGTSSTAQNPTKTYKANGNYNVVLSITNANGCTDTRHQGVNVEVNNCSTAFTSVPDTANPLMIHFADSSTGSPNTWLWTFGDGDTSRMQHPSHTYPGPGMYTVTLTIFGPKCNDSITAVTSVFGPMGIDAPAFSFVQAPYPNPVNSSLWIELQHAGRETFSIAMIDAVGRKMVYQEKILDAGDQKIEISVGHLPKGMYVLWVEDEVGGRIFYKVVKD